MGTLSLWASGQIVTVLVRCSTCHGCRVKPGNLKVRLFVAVVICICFNDVLFLDPLCVVAVFLGDEMLGKWLKQTNVKHICKN